VSPAPTPVDVVRGLWERMEARDWDGARATLADGSRVVARVRVAHGDVLFHCLSFADVDGDRIARSTDFWLDDGGDPAPDWRAPFRTPVPPPEVH
jgi:hypothetical protein